MRICVLTSAAFPPREGMGFYVWNLSSYLVRQGNSVQIITRGGNSKVYLEVVDGIKIWRLPCPLIFPIHVHYHSLFVNKLLNKLSTDIDLLHLHSPLVKFPDIELNSLVTVHTPIKADSKSIAVRSLRELLIKLQSPISIQLEQEIFSNVGVVSAVSTSVAQELHAYGIDSKSVLFMANGVDTNTFFLRNNHKRTRFPYILSVGRLAPRKGLEDLIEAARMVVEKFPEVHFLLAGEGPLEGKIRKEIRKYRLEKHLILLGQITNRERLADLYRNATIFVHPAHYEGLPTVLLEAMASGVPVISTGVSGAIDVIEDGSNGFLVPPHAPTQIANTIGYVLQNRGLCHRIVKAAWKNIKCCYSWDVVGQNYEILYQAIMKDELN
jgi:glycosyltransferase involved in cell wall biosynthesis